MSIKPFSKIVSDEKEVEQKDILKPFVDEAIGGTEIEVSLKDNSSEEHISIIKKSIDFLGSLQGLLSVVAVFILVAVVIDTIQTLQTLSLSSSILDLVYLIVLIALGTTLSIVTYRNYIQIKGLKNVKRIQELFARQKINPDKDIVPVTISLLNTYISSSNSDLKEKAELLQSRISSSHDYKEIYKDLDEEVVNIIDIEVQKKIKIASTQAAISTAISPLALLDAGIIIWRSFLLTKDVAKLYGFKPGWLSTIVLLKQGAFNIFFAGAAELASEYANEAAGSSITSKISTSAGQGITNGILLARLGYGVMEACRPLPIRTKRDSFINAIYKSIKSLVIK